MHLCGADVLLHMRDEDGQKITEVAAGQPFLLLVTVTDWPRNVGIKKPIIQGLQELGGTYAGYRMSSINGDTQIQFTYRLQTDTPGTYTIGPAVLELSSEKVCGESCSIAVVTQSTTDQSRPAGYKKGVWAQLTLNKGRVVVGEKIQGAVRLYFDNDIIERAELVDNALNGIRKINKNPEQGSEVIQGKKYHYIMWQFDMYPQKEGDIVIPSYPIVYQHTVDRNAGWSAFDMMFGQRIEEKTVYSNPITIHVDALPNNKTKVPVGTFTKFTAHAQPKNAKVGEGIVVALELTGDFEGDGVSLPLQSIEGCNSYESKTAVTPIHNGITKRFEFILQGLQPGDIVLPAQKFVYFDPEQRQYKTLKTKPLQLTIMPDLAMQEEKKEVAETKSLVTETEIDEPIRPLHIAKFQPVPVFVVPWWTFFMMMVLPLFGSGMTLLLKMIKGRASAANNRQQKAFVLALRALEQVRKKQDIRQLYYIFMQLFNDRGMTQEEVQQKITPVQLDEWQQFWLVTTQMAFTKIPQQHSAEQIFEQARLWLARLEQII